ncbi:hypothetical protein LCGC14_1291700 [marine sediment metagenome]|uniref:Major capsid protein n=1 Tax=marine sediment metagenome TaxID=412755 RepID=A0A0F9KTW2_9ZZZZ
MANTNVAATVWNCPNYTGELYLIGANQTPFLNMVGGLQGGNIRTVSDFQYPLAQPWALEAASQPAITETASLTAPNPWTYVRSQDVNTCQIWQRQVSVSYAKQSVTGQVTADGTTGLVMLDQQPVQNELDFQIQAHMRQIALDVDYTMLNGTYQQSTSAAVAAKTRGIITGATTNTVAAGAVTLTKALMDQLLRTMASNGAEFINPVVFVNAFQKQKLSDIYGYAPMDRNVGGYNIKQVETDFAILGIVWAPNVPAATLMVADLAFCAPVYLPVPDKGVLFYESLSKTGASESGQIYGQIGLDYGPEEYHGTITGLATA